MRAKDPNEVKNDSERSSHDLFLGVNLPAHRFARGALTPAFLREAFEHFGLLAPEFGQGIEWNLWVGYGTTLIACDCSSGDIRPIWHVGLCFMGALLVDALCDLVEVARACCVNRCRTPQEAVGDLAIRWLNWRRSRSMASADLSVCFCHLWRLAFIVG